MNISDIINSQIEAMSELNLILDQEKEILIKDNASELQAIMDKKKSVAIRISQLERARQNINKEKKAEEYVNEGLLEGEKLQKLIELSDSVQQKNDINLLLTRQSINYIRAVTFALNPSPKNFTYGNNGKIMIHHPQMYLQQKHRGKIYEWIIWNL